MTAYARRERADDRDVGFSQMRFELLLEHTDVPVFLDDMRDWESPAAPD